MPSGAYVTRPPIEGEGEMDTQSIITTCGYWNLYAEDEGGDGVLQN